MRKKNIFFVIDSLGCGGAEKSLVTLLSLLDYSKYDVDVQLFRYGGEFEYFLPKEVNLLPPLEYTNFLNLSIIKQLLTFDIKKIISRWSYSLLIRRKNLTHADKARFYWKCASECIPFCDKQYDVAIGYAHGIPTFYVVDKIKAKRKIAWVNAIYNLRGKNRDFQRTFYSVLDAIVLVSSSALELFSQVYADYKSKMCIIMDIIDVDFIKKMSNFPMDYPMKNDVPLLLTVARLDNGHKGYDIALEAAKILHERGVNFRWYVIGEGEFRNEMECFIIKNGLQDTFILLGAIPNPYPYIKECTMYVQTSRHEGFGLSIAEARILNRPVITTEFDAVYNQMIQGKNGIVVKVSPAEVANAVEYMLNNKKLKESIIAFQKQEKKGNKEELNKFYNLINVNG